MSLDWLSRVMTTGPLILDMEIAWLGRFAAQERFFIRHGMPKVRSLYEAERKPPAMETAIATLDDFRYGLTTVAYDRAIPAAFTAGALQAVRDSGSFLSFDARNPLVLEYLKRNGAAKLGRDVDETTKKRIRSILVQAEEERLTYRQTVKRIRELYQGFRAPSGIRNIRNRAELIAVTEIGNAYSAGSLGFAQDLQDRGTEMEKMWGVASGACIICQGNGAQGWIPVSRAFSSGHDAPLGHPGCRCSLMTRAKPLTQ